MMKEIRKTPALLRALPYAALAALTFFLCWFFAGRHGMFASLVDWISQHSVFPDYFRQQFYTTGELFPEFAPALGGGQNIYHFSYYGLYSPVILPSYLLPFVKMSDYLIAVSVLCLTASVLLFYYWMETRGFSLEIRLTASVLLLLAGPMIFQSCQHIMFVNYMPFLCMAFAGIDRYFKTGRAGLYTAGVFLMILTSFYFSIAGMLALLVYGLCGYQKRPWKYALLRFLLPMPIAVCSAGILLVPTAVVLLSRSGGAQHSFSLQSLFMPDFSPGQFACSAYGIGLGAGIVMILLVGITYKSRRDRAMSIACLIILTIPVFSWLLNGGLYVRCKALIPFLPLLCYLAAVYLEKQKKKEVPFAAGLAGCLVTILWCVASSAAMENEACHLVLIESALLLVFLFVYRKIRFVPLLLAPSVLCIAVFGAFYNGNYQNRLQKEFYDQVTDLAWKEEIASVLRQENGLYRLEQGGTLEEKKADINRIWTPRQWVSSIYSSAYQKEYQTFRTEIFGTEQPFRNAMMQPVSENPLFCRLMGVKYKVERTDKGFAVKEREGAAPVMYASDRVVSRRLYEGLDFPYNQTALMQYAVVEEDMDAAAEEKAFESVLRTAEKADCEISGCPAIQKEGGSYMIQSKKPVKTSIQIPKEKKDMLLYLQFQVDNRRNRDVAIDVEGIRNKLSREDHLYYNGNTKFTYVLELSADQTEAEIVFGSGEYGISDLKCFLGDPSVLSDETLFQSQFIPLWEKTKGRRISGEIEVKEQGYLVTSIPYDKGFEILVDGVHSKGERVNMAFLGFPVQKGKHKIDIVFHAPGMTAGKIFSVAGVLLWVLEYIVRKKMH